MTVSACCAAVMRHTSQPSPSKPDAVADAIKRISSRDCEPLRSSLVQIINLDEQHLGSDDWTKEWVAKGVLQVHRAADRQMGACL